MSKQLPSTFRLTSIIRLPGKHGHGIANEAMLYHDQASIKLGWQSNQVDSRLKRGCYVALHGPLRKTSEAECLTIQRLDLIDKPLASINPFVSIPHNWVHDRTLITRAANLWEQLNRPFQHLVTAILWDGQRLERFLTGPAALSAYRPFPNSNLRHAVDTAEQAIALAQGMPDVCRSVLIAAALLHDAGKADDYGRSPEGEGYTPSERGLLVGHRHTILEWLAVARSRDGVIVPDSQYLALIHALTASRGAAWLGVREPQTIEASILAVADRVNTLDDWHYPLVVTNGSSQLYGCSGGE